MLIPSESIPLIARSEGEWLVLELQPGSAHHKRLDEYRTPLASLGFAVEAVLGSE